MAVGKLHIAQKYMFYFLYYTEYTDLNKVFIYQHMLNIKGLIYIYNIYNNDLRHK